MNREVYNAGKALASGGLRVSVVIPALNEASRLPATLESVSRQTWPAHEVLVIDGGSQDETVALAQGHGVRVLAERPCRGAQLHAGARASTGDALVFLHADTLLPADGLAAVAEALKDPGVAGGKFRIRFSHDCTVLRAVSWVSRNPWAWLSYGDAAFFARKRAYREAGGFEPVPLFEDSRFFARLKRTGRIRVLEQSVLTDARAFVARGPARGLALNGALALAHALGVSPEWLDKRYRNPSGGPAPKTLRSTA